MGLKMMARAETRRRKEVEGPGSRLRTRLCTRSAFPNEFSSRLGVLARVIVFARFMIPIGLAQRREGAKNLTAPVHASEQGFAPDQNSPTNSLRALAPWRESLFSHGS